MGKRKGASAVKAGSPVGPPKKDDDQEVPLDDHIEDGNGDAVGRDEYMAEPQDDAAEEPADDADEDQADDADVQGSRSRSRSRAEDAEDDGAAAAPKKKASGGQLCFTFLIGKCNRENCPDRHPEDQKNMREKMQRTPCALGASCRRK